MLSQAQIENKIALLKNETVEISENFTLHFEADYYIKYVNSFPSFMGYRYLHHSGKSIKSIPQMIRSRKLKQKLKDIESVYGLKGRALYHKLALLYFLKGAVTSLNENHLPNEINKLCWQWYQRIFDDIAIQSDEFYGHHNDPFLKDLAVSSQRAFPVGGAWITEIIRLQGRTLLKILKSSPRQVIELLYFVQSKVGGFSQFYNLHTDIRYLAGFNPEGRDYCYSNIAELLKANPNMRGGCWRSWFNDPNLETISPRLAYLRQRPVQNGARTFRIGTSKSCIMHATAKSSTRKRLYEDGKYKPSEYMVIWPRKRLIEWADKHVSERG